MVTDMGIPHWVLLFTCLGHSPPQDCRLSRVPGELTQSSHLTCCTLIWQWHLMRNIWLHGGHGPGWHFTEGQLWVQPSGRGFWQPSSHSSQLSPCFKKNPMLNFYVSLRFINTSYCKIEAYTSHCSTVQKQFYGMWLIEHNRADCDYQ